MYKQIDSKIEFLEFFFFSECFYFCACINSRYFSDIEFKLVPCFYSVILRYFSKLLNVCNLFYYNYVPCRRRLQVLYWKCSRCTKSKVINGSNFHTSGKSFSTVTGWNLLLFLTWCHQWYYLLFFFFLTTL